MAAQYDAHLASEALRSSQERVSDLSFHMEDGENRLAEAEAAAAHAQAQAAAADDARAEAKARAASLAQQVRGHNIMPPQAANCYYASSHLYTMQGLNCPVSCAAAIGRHRPSLVD